MRDNLSLYKKVIFTIVIMSTFSAEADRYCMIGHKPTELEFRYARDACEEHAKTIEKLAELVAANPKNIEYKRQYEKWQYMATFHSNNEEYIYNLKLLHALSIEKSFSSDK